MDTPSRIYVALRQFRLHLHRSERLLPKIPLYFTLYTQLKTIFRRLSRADYTELIVSFISSIFQSAKPVSVTEIIQGLLQEPHIIIRRIAVRAITDHYSNLKRLFWEWEGNPLDEVGLEPEVSQLIQANSHTFNEDEMEQILQWIESTQY